MNRWRSSEFRFQAAQDRVNAELRTDETSGATVGRYPVPADHQMGVAGVAGCAPPIISWFSLALRRGLWYNLLD